MTLPFRPERLLLSSPFADEIARKGQVLGGIEHFADGTARVTLEPAADPLDSDNCDHAAACDCRACRLDRRLWHSFSSEDGCCECLDCAELTAENDARARLISRLKGRMLQLGAVFADDPLADPSEWRLLTPSSGGCKGCPLTSLGGCAPGHCAREASALLHPFGRCSCGNEGQCAWCRSTCPGCGSTPHGGDCPDFESVIGSA